MHTQHALSHGGGLSCHGGGFVDSHEGLSDHRSSGRLGSFRVDSDDERTGDLDVNGSPVVVDGDLYRLAIRGGRRYLESTRATTLGAFDGFIVLDSGELTR